MGFAAVVEVDFPGAGAGAVGGAGREGPGAGVSVSDPLSESDA